MGEEEPQVLIQINEKQWRFTALTLRLKLLIEKTKLLNGVILIHGKEKKNLVLSGAIHYIYLLFYS